MGFDIIEINLVLTFCEQLLKFFIFGRENASWSENKIEKAWAELSQI